MTESSSSSVIPLDERSVAQKAYESSCDQLQTLITQHAPTFVATERRTVAFSSSVSELLERLENCFPSVEEGERALLLTPEEKDDGNGQDVVSYAASMERLSSQHRLRRRTLLQHSSLLELLELPQLMDACVRSNLYDDALAISSLANSLERRHVTSSGNEEQGQGVVQTVIYNIRCREVDLRKHLLSRLRGDVSMPQCLEIVTALRRLNGIEVEKRQFQSGNSNTSSSGTNAAAEQLYAGMEVRLQVDFLESRDVWLEAGVKRFAVQSQGTAAHSHTAEYLSMSPTETLLEVIESYRTRCFEIATQFLAIFRASGSTSAVAGGTGTQPTSTSTSPTMLLSLWTTRRIELFLSLLQSHLDASLLLTNNRTHTTNKHPPASQKNSPTAGGAAILRDALEATSFFAVSMGRIGADFQSRLAPIFEPRLVRIVTRCWEEGVASLNGTLAVCREAGVATPLYNTSIGTDDISTGGLPTATANPEAIGDPSDNTSIGTDDISTGGLPTATANPEANDCTPPRTLLAHPPLARLVNSYLTGLNELRRCLLPNTFSLIQTSTASFLENCRATLTLNQRKVNTPGFLRGESIMLRKVAGELLEVFETVVVRYVNVVVCTALGMEIPPEWMVREEEQPQSPPEKEEQVTAMNNDDAVDNDDAPIGTDDAAPVTEDTIAPETHDATNNDTNETPETVPDASNNNIHVPFSFPNPPPPTILFVHIRPYYRKEQPQSPPEKEEQVTAMNNDDAVDNDDAPIGTDDAAPVTEERIAPEMQDDTTDDNNETPETVPDASN
eukprot:CAMPEP_0194399782 /NCGR_PEP_ID=MMETSP0174-20130528/126845_1 /TAXON_ID=216777 /ORGANISM="Proboscia alata, Strain PI-D3" /LENGTH=785 /DNA_ID=CAMNT_0039196217 /DNA_START=80 /DNA_END=2439 /DNA_ORIENTATION=+